MATLRDSNSAEFFKFVTVGAAIFGVISRLGTNQNGDYVTMQPAASRPTPSSVFTRTDEIAVGLSTDLASKVHATDVGKLLLFVFAGTKPTSQKPLKLFNVLELEDAEALALIQGVAMPQDWQAAPTSTVEAVATTRGKPAPF